MAHNVMIVYQSANNAIITAHVLCAKVIIEQQIYPTVNVVQVIMMMM